MGLEYQEFLSFSVESPFDYEEVMEVHAHDLAMNEKANKVIELMEDGQQTLILFKSEFAMKQFREQIPSDIQSRMAFEGERELSSIIKEFQQKQIQVLCSFKLWEGLDIPNDALTRVIIHDLPFPPADPLFEARRQHATDAFHEVDLPFMLLRLRQGAGRLIRTSADSGTIHLLLDPTEQQVKNEIEGLFPVKIAFD